MKVSIVNQANIFVHFIPVDHDEENEADPKVQAELAKNAAAKGKYIKPGQVQGMLRKAVPVKKEEIEAPADLVKKARDARPLKDAKHVGGHEQDNHDDEVLERHRRKYADESEGEEGAEEEEEEGGDEGGRTALHVAAAEGDLVKVEKLVAASPAQDADKVINRLI